MDNGTEVESLSVRLQLNPTRRYGNESDPESVLSPKMYRGQKQQ